MRRLTTKSFTLLLVAVLGALVGVQLVGVEAQRSADRAADDRVALAGDVAQIRYYDELLTMSARLAATTGDTSYVQRYRSAVPQLDRVLAHALSVVPDAAASDAVDATDDANQGLIALEERAFDLLAAGDRQGAYAAVSGPDYLSLKAEYRTEMDRALGHLERAADRRQAAAEQRQRTSLVAGVAAALLLVGLWTLTARGLHRSQQARAQIEEQLRVQAYADPLTGLANRLQFREHLASALQQESPSGPVASAGSATAASQVGGPAKLAVLFADLDHFKSVNDTRGHADGDALLVEVAERLTDLLHGRPGALVARLGGDEFAMLLPHTRAADAEQLADSVVSALARPYAAAPEIPVTVSVGLTVGRADDHDPGLLLRGADLAMYDAKSNGRGRWSRYAEHMHADLLARVELESQLREGLHRGELVLHYQPVVHLRTGARRGVEALVRWRHPERGLLSRGAFVPLAEKSDLIVALGWFVLQQACWQMAAWRAELGPHESGGSAPAEVAVSVSPRELSQPGYTAQVLATLHRVGLPPGCLVLEVTESTMMSDTSQVILVLADLRAAGIRIAIGDFGTGHSSLDRLHQLPVDQVKIDRSLIGAAAVDGGSAEEVGGRSRPGTTMLDLLVAVVDRLGLDLVAAGIETPRQLEDVRDTGCTYGQGSLLGPPQPAADERHLLPTRD